MGRKRHTPEQIITALREAEVGLARGKSVKLISRELGITEQTYDLPPRAVPHPMVVPAPVEGREGRASSGTRATA